MSAIDEKPFNVIGKPVQRLDSLGHVTGRTQFFEDVNPAGLLHLKMHRSERHHANIVSVDTSAAEAVKGVVKILTHEDVPKNWYTVLTLINVGYPEELVLAEKKVLWYGEPIVAVVATSERAAREGAAARSVLSHTSGLAADLSPRDGCPSPAPEWKAESFTPPAGISLRFTYPLGMR